MAIQFEMDAADSITLENKNTEDIEITIPYKEANPSGNGSNSNEAGKANNSGKKPKNMNEKKVVLSDNARLVLERRYLQKDEKGKACETPEDLFHRVAANIAEASVKHDNSVTLEQKEDEFYQIMANQDFMPNSPTLMNAGTEIQQLSACFVLPVGDSMGEIFESIKNTAIIHKSGGGTGFSFSRIRPSNDQVASTKGVSSGPISFMTVFDAATETVKQGGRRRGANMAILRIDHPDIVDFITAKEKESKLNNFNLSVGLTEDFMKKVETGEDYDLVNPRTKELVGTQNAEKIFNLIVTLAWKNGEPGIVFLDRINKDNPTPEIGEIESTNPCGEQPLLPYESCNLGSINLSKMVTGTNGDKIVDYEKLGGVVHTCVEFLDNVIDANRYPLPEIDEMTKNNRKIGLGVMGWADMLFQLGISYNSDEALELAEKVMGFINDESKKTSIELASNRGVFPNYSKSIFSGNTEKRLRNATTTTIAPTGTISIIAGASSGIEPLFAISYVRNVMDNDRLLEVHPIFEQVAKDRGFYSRELMERIAKKGSLASFDDVPTDIKKVFVTSHDITPEWHIKMQAAFQKHTDNAVSKTVNFPNSAVSEDIADVYKLAAQLGCKGVTVYRDGSRSSQVLSVEKDQQTEEEEKVSIVPRDRPKMTRGFTEKIPTADGKLYITVNYDEKGLCEVFTNIGKHGSDVAAWSEAVGRLISLGLRCGIDSSAIINQLIGISSRPIWQDGEQILSVPDAIGKVLSKVVKKANKHGQMNLTFADAHTTAEEETAELHYITCPDCGSSVQFESGCVVCHNCGFSKCG